ncbi:PucR family transcriptional regulator [Paeniglutamicibacter cryotolerans]|uniref:Purine catabolism regulator n=1 Tax=Paeniglutamicibacter cryotolerans TaxID=670079 RepID=A0A839QTZ6_9MICC|nr:PucR family transcriptional regulator [Paeniglutamicibacter cryotolerans]MBB2995501.1 purine catabolism regulator [Paeniglutamicibacter cryotolerans]
MISLLQLCDDLGEALAPAPGVRVSARPLTGVHVSELEDPTPYLEGGELLLTTGMPFAASADLAHAFMARLGARGVYAAGLGLGPWLRTVPGYVLEASTAAGVELVIVPDGVPFQAVSRAYWRLASRDHQANLMDSLGTQTALARAAMRPDATASVVRGLAQALGGWAAYLPADGGAETLWPASASAMVPHLRTETLRFNRGGTHSAATFEIHGQQVVAYPILLGNRTHGFLSIGSGRTLTKADRQVILTVSTLLALKARQRQVMAGTTAALGGATAKLLLHGQCAAAHMVAEEVGLGGLPERVRLLGIRLEPGDDAELAARAVGRLPRDPGLPDLEEAVAACFLRHELDGVLFLILTAGAEPVAGEAVARTLEEAEQEPSAAPVPPEDPTPSLAAVLSGPLGLEELPGHLAAIGQAALRAAPGRVAAAQENMEVRARTWAGQLAGYRRADLIGTVTAYLRHRGTWEGAARELGVHRNSLRHRISVVQSLLGVDLDDPDVAAHLWLALRSSTA